MLAAVRWSILVSALAVSICLLSFAGVTNASVIADGNIISLGQNAVHSGNGTLDLILMTGSNGGAGNQASGLNADDANTDMPKGNTSTANATYITSIGELRTFYRLNFPDGFGGATVNRIDLVVDLNQPKDGPHMSLDVLQMVIDYTPGFGDGRDDPAAYDLSSSLQNDTQSGFSGGTLVAWLDGPKVLPLIEQGAGWADYVIRTGVDPFDSAYTDSTRILFHLESSGHSDGDETIFLSGSYVVIPEPAALVLLALGGLAMGLRRRV